MNKMFFDEDYEPEMVLNDRIERLEEDLELGERILNPTSLPERWAYFSYLKGLEEGLSEMYSINFGYYISSFIAGMGIDAGTDVYFKINIDDKVFDIFYETINKQYPKKEEIVKEFFNKLLEFYKSPQGAVTYEKAVFLHNVSCSSELKQYLKERDMSAKQFILSLLQENPKHPQFSNNKEETISFKLTYTQESVWNQIRGDTDPEKIQHLVKQ